MPNSDAPSPASSAAPAAPTPEGPSDGRLFITANPDRGMLDESASDGARHHLVGVMDPHAESAALTRAGPSE
jgi:hypothetical protein